MTEPSRRTLLAGSGAALAVAALPAAARPATPLLDQEVEIRALLVRNVRQKTAELAEATAGGDVPWMVDYFHRYGLHLDLEELRLFDRGEGSWRHLYRLPMAPGAFTGSAADLPYRDSPW